MTVKPLLAIVGPTACGKTARAVAMARRFGGEIVSADSRQVYKGMDIGTGKDLAEYGDIPAHLLDIAPAGYKYNLFEFLRDCSSAVADIRSRGLLPVVCGGTGMYVESYLKGMRLPEVPENPELRRSLSEKTLDELTEMLAGMKRLHNSTDVDTRARAIRAIEIETYYLANPQAASATRGGEPVDAVIVGLDIPRDERRKRITARLRHRLDEEDMCAEVRGLLDSGIAPDDLIYYGLEYKYITLYVTGKMSRQEMETGLETAIHQFAKRQMTWFRGMERRGFKINWLPYDMPPDEFGDAVEELLTQGAYR